MSRPRAATLAPPPIANFTGAALGSLVDLLNASAHSPDNWPSSVEDDSTDDYDDSDTDGDALPTPSDSQVYLEPHHYDESVDPLHPEYTNDKQLPRPLDIRTKSGPVRGTSLLTRDADEYGGDLAIEEMAMDGIESADETVARSQKASDGSDAPEDSFEDPKVVDAELSKEERLKTLTDEFGVWKDGSEEFVESIPGALYRGILIKGLLALTTRRFFIYAYIPRVEANKLVRSGPVTVHIPGPFTKKRRCWIELKSDSVSWYQSSDKLYKPIGSCRLSQAKAISPYNTEEPTRFRIDLIDGRCRFFELDTAESAVAWHADMTAALFTFRATADKLRLSLPLQLISRVEFFPYMSLGERVEVNFEAGRCPFASPGESTESLSVEESRSPQLIEFGYLKNHHDFVEKLQAQVKYAHEHPIAVCEDGATPILEIDSEARQTEETVQKEIESDKGLPMAFIKTFALHDSPSELFIASSCQLVRSLPTWGSLCISKFYLCFWRKAHFGSDVKLRIPLTDIDDVGRCKAFGFRIVGLAIQVHGAPDVRLDFHSKKQRDQVIEKIKEIVLVKAAAALELANNPVSPTVASPTTPPLPFSPNLPTPLSSPSQSFSSASNLTTLSQQGNYVLPVIPGVFHGKTSNVLGHDIYEDVTIPAGLPASGRPTVLGAIGKSKLSGLHIVCLTIGSRGDVQPYIALGKELMKDGNRVTIASHPEYRAWVESYGIGYKEVGGDPAALMKLSVEHKMFSPGFFKESLGHFRQWLDDLFAESWAACQDADLLIESPSTMAGIHAAEALGIPYFRAFTMPWTATSTYPQAFAASVDLGPTYNQLSYTLFDNIIWKATAGQVNRWRKNMLDLQPTNMHKLSQAKTPFIYNFSAAVVPKPNDWRDFISISGYWFLDSDEDWTPPEGLMEFIQKARDDDKKIIYIGFGSIVVPDSAAVTKAVVNAVLNSDVRAVLSKGWSERGATKVEDVELPPEIFSVPSIAHDRLFPLIDAAVHHGGAGTTGASLRAGLPTLIHPFFGDQASRVTKLGAGIHIHSLGEKDLTAAFKQATTDRIMREKAQAVGQRIVSENGPRAALTFIYDHIHLAQERADLRAARARKSAPSNSRTSSTLTPSESTGKASTKQSSILSRALSIATDPSCPLTGRRSGSQTRASTLPPPVSDAPTSIGVDRSSTVKSTESV